MSFLRQTLRTSPTLRMACVSALAFGSLAGCKQTAAPADDAALARTIQSQLSGDSSLSGQPIQAGVQNGIATISGSVANDAQRTIAARDAAGVSGVKEVINNLNVLAAPPASATAVAPPPVLLPAPPAKTTAMVKPQPVSKPLPQPKNTRQPAPIERPQYPAQSTYTPPPAPVQQAPPPPAQPTFRTVTVPSGNTLPVRVTQTLDSATTQQDSSFSGVVASDVLVDGVVAIPAGASVSGHVDAVQEAAHFKGSSLLTVSLVSVSRRGERLPISTAPYTVEGKGRGKNTAEKVGGGAAVGAILGGIFGGGKGAAIGAAAGGGVGAGANTITRGQQVQIPSETVVRFKLTSPITVRVRTDANETNRPDSSDPALQRRPNN